MVPELEIVIPVYNEGPNITGVLAALARSVGTSFRVLICYDDDDDDTLEALKARGTEGLDVRLVKNRGRGVLGAVVTGFQDSVAPAVMVLPADDNYNAPRVDGMMAKLREGYDIIVASRFVRGGCMRGCPLVKAALVRLSSLALRHVARLPTHDPTNGFRLFSRRVVDRIPVESSVGFAYSIELLVKCHRLHWQIGEVPAEWYQRRRGESRFRVLGWAPQYLRWLRYAFATTFLRRGPATVTLRDPVAR